MLGGSLTGLNSVFPCQYGHFISTDLFQRDKSYTMGDILITRSISATIITGEPCVSTRKYSPGNYHVVYVVCCKSFGTVHRISDISVILINTRNVSILHRNIFVSCIVFTCMYFSFEHSPKYRPSYWNSKHMTCSQLWQRFLHSMHPFADCLLLA